MTAQAKNKAKLVVMKDAVSKEATTGLTVVGSTIAATATATIPVYDEKGVLLGHVALFDTATLT